MVPINGDVGIRRHHHFYILGIIEYTVWTFLEGLGMKITPQRKDSLPYKDVQVKFEIDEAERLS